MTRKHLKWYKTSRNTNWYISWPDGRQPQRRRYFTS